MENVGELAEMGLTALLDSSSVYWAVSQRERGERRES